MGWVAMPGLVLAVNLVAEAPRSVSSSRCGAIPSESPRKKVRSRAVGAALLHSLILAPSSIRRDPLRKADRVPKAGRVAGHAQGCERTADNGG